MLRRTLIKAAFGLSLAVSLLPSGVRAEGGDAGTFIEKLADTAIATVADKQLAENDRDARFRQLFVSNFDLPTIGKFVLARYWKAATPEQQQEFLKLFEDQVVLTWAKRFKDYSGEKLHVVASNKEDDHTWLVESQILRDKGPPVAVQWRLHDTPDGAFRITDIIVEGVSMAITQRQDFSATLQGTGGKIDALLSSMRTKVDQLKAAG
jgi:phospholipid transport system substrate-binding protein